MSEPADNVIYVQPKTERHNYKRQTYTLTFMPKEKKWTWEYVYTNPIVYRGTAKTLAAARRAAQARIDELVGET